MYSNRKSGIKNEEDFKVFGRTLVGTDVKGTEKLETFYLPTK
jgi:hypothetical protein